MARWYTGIGCGASVAALALSLTLTGFARADFITDLSVSVAPNASDILYTYTLSNLPESDLSAIALDIQVDTDANLYDLSAPTGWLIFYTAGDTHVSWQSPDPQFDLSPGNSFQFSFVSFLDPSLADFTILGIDENSPQFQFNNGLVLSPLRSVPEPSGIILTSYGLLLLAFFQRRRAQAIGAARN